MQYIVVIIFSWLKLFGLRNEQLEEQTIICRIFMVSSVAAALVVLNASLNRGYRGCAYTYKNTHDTVRNFTGFSNNLHLQYHHINRTQNVNITNNISFQIRRQSLKAKAATKTSCGTQPNSPKRPNEKNS